MVVLQATIVHTISAFILHTDDSACVHISKQGAEIFRDRKVFGVCHANTNISKALPNGHTFFC